MSANGIKFTLKLLLCWPIYTGGKKTMTNRYHWALKFRFTAHHSIFVFQTDFSWRGNVVAKLEKAKINLCESICFDRILHLKDGEFLKSLHVPFRLLTAWSIWMSCGGWNNWFCHSFPPHPLTLQLAGHEPQADHISQPITVSTCGGSVLTAKITKPVILSFLNVKVKQQ